MTQKRESQPAIQDREENEERCEEIEFNTHEPSVLTLNSGILDAGHQVEGQGSSNSKWPQWLGDLENHRADRQLSSSPWTREGLGEAQACAWRREIRILTGVGHLRNPNMMKAG